MSENNITPDQHYMRLALKEAVKALDADEVPIGCVIVENDQIIAKGYNQTHTLNDCTAHAEMIAMTSAFGTLNSTRLKKSTLYVTVEPCAMCAGAMKWAQLGRLVYGTPEDKSGYSLYLPSILHPKTEVLKGVEAENALDLLQHFFQSKRS